MPKKENKFQAELIKELRAMYPEAIILKNDADYLQGFPDLSILYGSHWAVLECKRSINETYEPNQESYLAMANEMSFGRMICPENKEEVLNDLQRSFST